jgi:plastocyanin
MRSLYWRPLLVFAGVGLVIVVAASPAVGGQGAGGSEGVASKGVSVSLKDNVFGPKSVSVARGGKVTWRWRGSNPHNVKFRKVPKGASKRGAGTKSSGRFSRSFTKSGTYRYVCTIHVSLGMKGSVSVK